MRDEVKKARKAFERSKPKPKDRCDRCGMTVEEHNALGKSKMQIHHIESIKDKGMAANAESNYVSLDYFCHREWHTFWEPLGLDWEDFMKATPFLDQLKRDHQ